MLKLDSFPGRDQPQAPKWTLLVMSHGRWNYLGASLTELDRTVGLGFFDRRVLSVDGGHRSRPGVAAGDDWEVLITGSRQGLTANLQQAWDALGPDEWILHLEEDFLVRDAPLDEMRAVLEQQPRVAQMVLERQPLNPSEVRSGGLLGGDNIPSWNDRGGWREQQHLFSFNPCVYHSSIATVAGTETVVTERLLAEGRTFGFWGAQGDAPRCEHIGVEGGMGSAGWAA